MDDLDIALHATAQDFGFGRMAALMGKGEQSLRNMCNPNVETHKVGLREAAAMVSHSGDTRIAEAFARMCGGVFMPDAERRGSMGLMRAFLLSERESSDVTRVVAEALEDGTVTPREAAKVASEISEAIAALQRLQAEVVEAAEKRLKLA